MVSVRLKAKELADKTASHDSSGEQFWNTRMSTKIEQLSKCIK